MSDLDALAREHSDRKEFILAALSDEYFNLKKDKDTIEFLNIIFDNAHKDLDMEPTQVTEVLPKSADAGEYIADFEKSKAPQFKGKSKKKRKEMAIAAFMAANKGKKMTKEEVTEALVEFLSEAKAYKVTSASGQTTTQSFGSDQEANDFKARNTNIRAVQQLEEDDWQDTNDESSMAKSQLYSIAKYAIELMKMIEDGEQLDAWVQSKITKAADYVNSVKNYMEGEKALSEVEGVDEIQTDMFATRASKVDSGKETYFKFLRAFAKSAGKSEEELRKMSYNDLEKEFGEKLVRKYGLKQRNVADRARELIAKGVIQVGEIEEAKEKLDPVGKEDSDINNDGKVDKTDKYLKGRRVKIGQAIAQYKKK